MRFTIMSQDTDIPLQLDISGYHIEVSDISDHSISVSDADGRLAVCFTKQDALLQPVAAETVPAESISAETAPVNQVAEVAASQEDMSVADKGMEVDSTGASQAADLAVAALKAEVSEVIDSEQLFRQLVALRKQLASELRLPPYIIFHDKTLRDMCRLLPTEVSELSAIQGVGRAKLEKYGASFIQAIQEYLFRTKEVA